MISGGIANKWGNEYERKWAVLKLLDVIAGNANAIRYEGITEEFRGFEFSVHLQHHVGGIRPRPTPGAATGP